MGEDVGKLGGVFRITEGLQKDFGEDRVIDTPLAESGIVGSAIAWPARLPPGRRDPVRRLRLPGVRPDRQPGREDARPLPGPPASADGHPHPLGGGIGAVEHHSESNEAYFAHTAGLRVVTCSDAADGYWMMQQAIASDDPVIFFEPKRRYHERGTVEIDEAAGPVLGLHDARVLREGTDATLLCYGPMVKVCLAAAEAAEQEGRSLEVLDLRSLSPLDLPRILESVRKTGRAVVVHEASTFLGSARRSPPSCSRRPSTTSRRPSCGSAATTSPTAEPLRGALPARPRPRPRRRRPIAGVLTWRCRSSTSPTPARASPRPTSSPGGSPSATRSRSTTWSSRSRPRSRSSSCPSPSPAGRRAARRRGRHRRRRRTDHRRRHRGRGGPRGRAVGRLRHDGGAGRGQRDPTSSATARRRGRPVVGHAAASPPRPRCRPSSRSPTRRPRRSRRPRWPSPPRPRPPRSP